MKTLGKLIVGFLWTADLAVSVWCLGAIWFLRAVPSPAVRLTLIVLFALVTLAVLVGTFRRRWILFFGLLLPIGFVAEWLHLLKPTGTLDWDVPFQRMPHMTFAADGHTVTVENVRDFRYRAEFDYDVSYRTETYDLDDIVSMDYSITHWNDLEPFGHIILSFRFCTGWRGTFNGITDRLGYWSGWLKRKRPDETFAEMRERCSVNKYVKDVKDLSDYSRLLRNGF